jgi:hypothetical protein
MTAIIASAIALFTWLMVTSFPKDKEPTPANNVSVEVLVYNLRLREQQLTVAKEIISNNKHIIANLESIVMIHEEVIKRFKLLLDDNNIDYSDIKKELSNYDQ